MQTTVQTPVFPGSTERMILFLVGAVQFVNILDFMMVMPLGPDFAPALGIHSSELGWIGGSYTAAAAVAGLLSALFIDRLDRRKALLFCLAGLVIATAMGGFAWDMTSLLATRILAGMFGGPATSLAWSIVADVVESARRGRAMGKVMAAFSLASIFGVPFGLEMANWGDWTTPFFVTAFMGLIVMLMVMRYMPALTLHLVAGRPPLSVRQLVKTLHPAINQLTFVYITIAMAASFMIIPNISAYLQYNHQYPRDSIGWLYCLGGVVSFFTMRMTGRMIDRYSATLTSYISTGTYIIMLWIVFIAELDLPVPLFFVLLMFALGMRNVSSTTLATKIPSPQDRAGFMSVFSCMQAVGMSAGAFYSTQLLTEAADHSIIGMQHIALVAAIISVLVPLIMQRVEKRLVRTQ